MSQTSSFSLPIGPVHVALEEPVYFHLDVDGETVRKVEITSGHVHRGMEGMATQRNFFKNTTLTERVCSLCSNSHSDRKSTRLNSSHSSVSRMPSSA